MSSGTVDSAQIDFQLNLIQPSSTSWQRPSKGNNETAHYKENKITVGIVRENARIQGPVSHWKPSCLMGRHQP